MNINEILVRSPINRSASHVVSQKGCSDDRPLAREELAYLVLRLQRKHGLMKSLLQIKTKRQHKNVVYKMNAGIQQFRAAKQPRIFAEYVRVGNDIQRLLIELSVLRKIRQFVGQAENEWKASRATQCCDWVMG